MIALSSNTLDKETVGGSCHTNDERRKFILIDTLPEDFLKDSDFNFDEEIILELDF